MSAEYIIHTPLKPSELPSLEDISLSREKPKKQSLVQKAVNKVVKGISSKWGKEALAITIGAGSGVAAPIIQEGNLPTFSDLGITIETPKAEAEEESSLPLSFLEIWQKTDARVSQGQGGTWLWGPKFTLVVENYSEAQGGRRLVAYFDKSRMEINHNPEAKFPWLVTNGLLVKEMVTGQMQVGDNSFIQKEPSIESVAGDPGSGVTYKDLELYPDGARDFTTDNVYSEFYQASEKGAENYNNIKEYASGKPIGPAKKYTVKLNGVDTDVIVQPFERRIMTYTPDNPAEWRVEMGNVGQHYYKWRYGESPIQEPVGGPKRPKDAEELLKRTNIIDSTVYNRNGKDYTVETRVTDSVGYKVTMVNELKQELGRLISQDGERHGFTSAELVLLGSEDEVPEGVNTGPTWVGDPVNNDDYLMGYFASHKFNNKVLVYFIPSSDIPFDNEVVIRKINWAIAHEILKSSFLGGKYVEPPQDLPEEYKNLRRQLPLQITSK